MTLLQCLKPKNIFNNKIEYASSSTQCIKDADCCIIVTEWKEFQKLKPEDYIKNMRNPILIDGRRIYDLKTFQEKEIKYAAIDLGKTRLSLDETIHNGKNNCICPLNEYAYLANIWTSVGIVSYPHP
ncbi:MAG: UDP-glucose/GDP-mannose dehydrogenase family protein [Candidatus Jordarchaeaceae archaeon]